VVVERGRGPDPPDARAEAGRPPVGSGQVNALARPPA